jgi:hypothetical protein
MSKKESYHIVLSIVVGLIIAYFISNWKPILIFALVIGLLGIISSKLCYAIERLWITITKTIGLILTSILLTFVYYLLLFPISVVERLFNKDALMLSRKHKSHFINSSKVYNQADFEKMW